MRSKMRTQYLPDPIEHLDFHISLTENCAQLERLVCSGHYLPAPAHRILMEKSKGLCRQVVLPNVKDALILQCLSDALYADIKGKAPSKRSFFEPEDHSFSNIRKSILGEPRYGSFRAWLNFQKELFKFTEEKRYIAITDISNYYDFISYSHLRNIIASKIEVRESILDMLIFILSGLLWQPDYAPRIEIGLPQMDIDATRILAHCFLYELDAFLENGGFDFVRYMDDIDVGVDTVDEARRLFRDMDLILHTRQVRLNSGKTLILNSNQAERHFRVRENYLISSVVACIDRKMSKGMSLDRERRHVRWALHRYYRKGKFDDGNGVKILNRLMTLAKRIDAKVDIRMLNDILRRRPAARSHAFSIVEWQPLTPVVTKLVVSFLTSGIIVDELSYIEGADALVHCEARTKPHTIQAVEELVKHLTENGFFGVYAAIWLLSKYGQPSQIYEYLIATERFWRSDAWLGRLVGGVMPIFYGAGEEAGFRSLVLSSKNPGAEEVMRFHTMLRTDPKAVVGVKEIVAAPNTSKRLGITHSKFLILLSVLANNDLSDGYKKPYINAHKRAWKDAFYRGRVRLILAKSSLRFLVKP